LNCTLDILSIDINAIDDSLVSISDDSILNEYNNDKDEKYLIVERVAMEFVLWENIDASDLDSLNIIDMQDSLLQLAIDFSSEAEMTSFKTALGTYNIDKIDTVYVTESFNNNSGLPFQMGNIRNAVRFAFDNRAGDTSEQLITDNGIAVFHIIDNIPKEYTPLNEVENNIKRILRKKSKINYAKSLFKDNDLYDWEVVSSNNTLFTYTNEIISTLNGNFQPIGRSNELLSFLLDVEETKEISDIIESSTHVFIAIVKSIDIYNSEKFASLKDSLKNQLLLNKSNQVYSNWLRAEKENLKIKDLRHEIF